MKAPKIGMLSLSFVVLSSATSALAQRSDPLPLARLQGRVALETKELDSEKTPDQTPDQTPHPTNDISAEMKRVVIYVVGLTEPPPNEVKTVEQKDTTFSPVVLPVTRGQTVKFANVDSLVHNVFSTSEAKEFDLGDQSPGARHEVTFTKTGLVQIFCNIHPQMSLTVLVLPNNKYTQPGADGQFSLTGLPRRKFKVFAYHPRARAVSQDVDFSSGEARHDFKLILSKTPPTHLNKHGKPYKKSKY
jgi:plastocyanin